MKCDNCQGKNDVVKLTVSGKELILCVECRAEQLGRKISTKGWEPED